MKPITNIRWEGAIAVAVVIVMLGLATPVASGWVPFVNNNMKGLDADVEMLDTTDTVEGDFTTTYTYRGEKDTKTYDIGNETLFLEEPSTANDDLENIRWLNVDLGAIALPADAEDPEYRDTAPFDRHVTIEFPEKADILWEDTASEWCYGFVLTRGHAAGENSTNQQSYKIQVGSGDAILYETTVPPDKDTGDADTNKEGQCLDASDVSEQHPEFGGDFTAEGIADFLGQAYVSDDPNKPSDLWVKIFGPRAVTDHADYADELGDEFWFGVQYYTWSDKAIAYNEMAIPLIVFGAAGIAGAIFIIGLAPAKGDIKHAIRPQRIRRVA